MFEKPFALLNRAVDRIETQLESADSEQKRILGEELVALRNACDKFVEQWLSFEERVSELSEEYNLELDGTLPSPELQEIQDKLAALQSGDSPFAMMDPDMDDPQPSDEQVEQPTGEKSDADAVAPHPKAAGKKPGTTLVYQIGDGQSMRPRDEQMVRSFRLGIGYFDLLMFPEAMEQFQRVLELDGDFLVARLYLAFGCLSQGEYEQASHHLNLITVREEDDFLQATIHSTYGHIFVAQEEYESALVEFEMAAKLVSDFRDIEFNIACCHYNKGRLREALTHFQRNLITQPEDWESHRLCGLIWEQLGHRDRAYRHLARSYDLNGAHEQVILDFAQLSEQQGKPDQARALYKKALRYHPTSAGALGGLGWIKMREGDVPTAVSLFKKQLSCSPNDRQGLFNLGWASYQTKDYGRAERCFSMLLRKNSRDSYALAGLARTWSMLEKRGEAKDQLLQLVAMEGSAEKKLGLYHLGRLAIEEESYTQALRYFNAALVYDRDCVESLFYKGVAHYALGELERAQQCFEKCK
ncbi:tetratricopeptide repeat protein [Tumebacillus permanentifrigoris]|uniref:Flp pilus assembly protein TadD n=1 Tax=Tumebacillus permanentifrigoris TaxID=378543 RepID=A0A316DBI5_9BACL|nr:tetratricopeptide repeat protein [Tumebacillus permanentifrigoris]PWK15561.1 Flp pilus assembly protein TadD [Tumebacillus permanentifrigoris]